MIRRLFWLTLGAVLGITGYRRAAAAARSLAGPLARPRLASRVRHRPALPRPEPGGAAVPSHPGFLAEVRAGMALYMERHPPPSPLNLEDQHPMPGRAVTAARPRRAYRDKDGH